MWHSTVSVVNLPINWILCAIPSKLAILVGMTKARFAEVQPCKRDVSFETSEPGSPSRFKTTGLAGWQGVQGRSPRAAGRPLAFAQA